MESLAYSLDSSQPDSPTGPYDIKRIHGMGGMAQDDDGGEYSTYSEEMSRMSAYNQYQEQADGQQHHQLPTVNEYQMNNTTTTNVEEVEFDATATVHEMHRKLLHLLSHPELFTEALVWESKLERGLDPSRPDEEEDDVGGGGGGDGGIKSFENEFGGADEQKDEETDDDGEAKGNHRQTLLPPLPLQIFAADAEVVLPQALTATQLFGMERVTGIELEAAAGITGLSHLFQRWLALMPEGDHMNIIRPPGLTVMRISGGRYRVTAAHRVVWRWMNKFSFSDAMFQGPSDLTDTAAPGDEEGSNDTDFDFGDLVTMTIIDVFETDVDGRLLSYCPTFDNRAVHKTQETVERIKKGATQFKERIEVVKKSPAGQSAQHVAEDLGKRGLSAAFKGFTLVKNRIETEIHNRQHPRTEEKPNVAASTASSDAVGGEDIGDEASEK
eukprot:CAMPEP_0113418392 /NCGR_PEP_ID=MMETSP0013_2-20120614/26181_1 /TAXON_ID=2843 ORGANISM="Skeletonema costatum, Strain 1716" /NCGR_SAMPLE_ID=MMETSP0013_2 /ASSEMBLY_ACC=CAM_ASM_000158 /LENGTH=440 /DNA_ID=CAMNT_0000305623 /DNA_START=131 /DNA_END=1453 /DNA_ORIENTATION=+ /assembly_acc=CAM_ASM_000158